MAINSESPASASNPGSYSDFLESRELEGGQKSIEGYSEALRVYRLALAAELGITLDDLHDRRTDYSQRDVAA